MSSSRSDETELMDVSNAKQASIDIFNKNISIFEGVLNMSIEMQSSFDALARLHPELAEYSLENIEFIERIRTRIEQMKLDLNSWSA